MIKYKLNKKILIIVIIIIFLVASASYVAYAAGVIFFGDASKVQTSSIQKGLVGHWALDGDGYNASTGRVTDKTPNENHGNNYGATLTTDRMGQSNGAMSFNGSNNYVNLGLWNSTLVLKALRGDWSYGAWIKTSSDGYIINCSDTGDYVTLSVTGGKAKFLVKDYSPAPEKVASTTSVTSVNNNQWHYVAGVWSGDNIYVYVDGVMEGSASGLNAFGNLLMSSWSGSWTIGAQWDSCCSASPPGNRITNRFTGFISDVRIYNRALSAAEVATLYGAYKPKVPVCSLQQGLVLDMPLTSDYTKTVTAGSQIMTDRTPYSNDGQNNGASIGVDGATFNGSNYITFNNPINQPNLSQEWSVSAWVNINDADSQTLISGLNYGLGLNYSSTKKLLLYLNGAPNDYYIYSSATGLLANLGWKHVVYIFRNSDGFRKIYIDTIDRSGSGPNQTSIPNGILSQLRIGQGVNGKIVDVRIYNRALSVDEVKSLFDKGG